MKLKIGCSLSALTFFMFQAFAQDSIQATIVLIGDAGELTNGKHPVVTAARTLVPMNEKTTVLFLGDNLYKTGLPDNSLPTYEIAKAPLDSQIRIRGNNKTKVYFVPGNHDWANGGSLGYASILRVQSYIDYLSEEYVHMYPRDGCPGPVEAKINNDVTLVMMDSQWWLHEKDKPGIESDCPYKTKAEVKVQLEDILARNSQKLVILALHHTFKSHSPHGGYFTWKQHIFPFTDINPNLYIPLPIIGSIYPLTRAVFGTEQDLKHPLYQALITEIEGVVAGHKNVIFVGGHDHSLQLIKDSGYNFIVSGSGCKTTRVKISKGKNTPFAMSKTGLAIMQVTKNKNAYVTFYSVEGDSVKREQEFHLLDFSKVPLKAEDTMRQIEYAFKDSVVISASDRYKDHKGYKQVFLGKNYRDEWSTPIAMRMFNIKKEKGGLIIKSLGGGKQTKSLQLEDKNGNEWALRSIDKDPEKALPQNLRGTIAQSIVQDMISASHPYAPLVIPDLAKAVGLYTPQPEFFFVPDDPALGYYRPLFANTVVMLESRDPAAKFTDTRSTNKVINKLLEDNEHHVDQEKVLNARFLDMLIADFDRHADQWKWGTTDTGKGKLYFPVPKDRDQAFFNSDGVLTKYLSKDRMRFLQGFKNNIKDINGLNYVAKDFDRFFLTNLDEEDWNRIAAKFAENISDKVIHTAVSKLPAPIAAMDAKIIEEKLISRRTELMKKYPQYYRFLSKKVSVVGSNEKEYFHLKNNNGNLLVTVYKKTSVTDSATVMYKRTFDSRVTKEICLYGLNGDDKFVIDPDVNSKINLRIIGGKGKDTFDLRGKIHNFVYDLSTEKNAAIHLKRTNKEFSKDVNVIDYKNYGFQYNESRFPLLNVGYNEEDKFLFGVGLMHKTYGFRKEPFATSQKLSTLFAISQSAYQIKYEGVFNSVFIKNDVLVKTEMANPTLNNFFGFGNKTEINKEVPLSYYHVRFKYVSADVLVRKRLSDLLSISVGPSYYHYWNRYSDNKEHILSDPSVGVGDSTSLYSVKDYLGVKARLDLSYINNDFFPTRGITWNTVFTSVGGMNNNSRNYSAISSDMAIYASVSDPGTIMSVFRLGGGHVLSDYYEYFQALNLGSNNFLRGFRKNRFSGNSLAYGSAEVRVRLFKSQSYVLPGDVGLLGFFETGRVWQKGEESHKWHNSYGGGIYYVPYNLLMISAAVGITEEDQLFNFSLGTKFNITF